MSTKHLVISAVNLVEGGTLEILRQCLLEATRLNGWRVTAIVHDSKKVGVSGVNYVERSDIKSSWLKRIYFEYFECQRLAEELQPDFWLSMHDMTPSLRDTPQAVYCHNAMCFYRFSLLEIFREPKLFLFSRLYDRVYKLNINMNRTVIVQQDWIRQEFVHRFACQNVMVAHPHDDRLPAHALKRRGNRFFYPSIPRFYKNFETLLEAWRLLCESPDWDGKLIVTVDKSAGNYGRRIVQRYKDLRSVEFVGILPRDRVQQLYAASDCLVFPSKLETWGLPITEAKQAGLALLIADQPYAREAVGNYDAAAFFPAEDADILASLMRDFSGGALHFSSPDYSQVAEPHAASWGSLLSRILPS